ncbi:MAG: hypothetical protein KDA96_10390, partial [Planctomycetaceae bacterium]|nr:hypothetical protein [Planctomycetaceae bacterium]
ITNLALHYTPDEIQFYLIDFKKGVEFRTYAANRLPHARVVAIESDREFGLSVLERLDEILQERGELFRSRGVQDVPSFRRQFPGEAMPRLLLLIDEFQEFFTSEDRVASRASLLLDRLIRQGRAFGIHVLLGSQTLGGAYSLARSTLGQVAIRIALQCSESDAHLILSEENSAARLLTRPGEAIYNDANGMVEGNHPFQIAWLDEDHREQLIHDMLIRPDASRFASGGMVVFEGNVPPAAELCAPLNAWLRQEADATRRASDCVPIWIGEPVAIAAPTSIELRRASGQNLLIVGQDNDMADSILAMCLMCCAAETPAGETTEDVLLQDSAAEGTATPTKTARVAMLRDTRDRDSMARFDQLLSCLPESAAAIYEGNVVDQVIAELHEDLVRRESDPQEADQRERVLLIRNIGQFRSLRKDDDEFGFGGFGEAKAETPASRLSDLVKRGPLVGIHVIVWSDTFNNAIRWLSNTLMREFENRIAFRMNQTDSASLIDTPMASALGPGRAILYRDQTGSTEKLRPFAWPGNLWIEQASQIWKGSPGDDLDIDSLTIE